MLKNNILLRFKNHKDFINNFINYNCHINPRMTRDFEIVCRNNQDKKKIVSFLKDSYVLENKKKVKAFRYIDTKYDKRIFTSFTYSGDIKKAKFVYKNKSILLEDQLDFVAIKNGRHMSKGWVFQIQKQKYQKN